MPHLPLTPGAATGLECIIAIADNLSLNPRPYRGALRFFTDSEKLRFIIREKPPLRFFTDSEKLWRVAPPGFVLPYGANLAQFLAKKIDRVRSGHGVMTS